MVKHLLLLCAQTGIKSFGRFGALLHVRVALGFHGLHHVQAFGRGHFFHARTFGSCHAGWVLHGLCERVPRRFLCRLQIQFGLELGQTLRMALAFVFTLVLAHFLHAASTGVVGRRRGVLGQGQTGQTDHQGRGDQGSANRFHENILSLMGCLQCDPPMYPGCARMVLICKDQVFLFLQVLMPSKL